MKIFLAQVSFLSFAFAFVLACDVCGQDAANAQTLKTPVSAEIADQPGNPLHLSIVSIDVSDERSQKINFTIQNLGEKSVRGYVLRSSPETVGTVETNFFPRKAFMSGSIHNVQINIVNENIRSDDVKVTIAIDYVLFTDQTGWGEDKEKRSDTILGQIIGTRMAGAGIVALIKGSGMKAVEDIVSRPPSETFVRITPGNQDRSENWKTGYRTGYRSVLYFVQSHYKEPDLLTQLEEAMKCLH